MKQKKPLGRSQWGVLHALHRYKSFHQHCGWVWETKTETLRILASLIRRGFVTKTQIDGLEIYKLTPLAP
jgi:hypothetical protein